MTTPRNLFNVAQAAEELELTRRAVIHRIHAGTLAATKIGTGRTSAYVITGEEIARLKSERSQQVPA